MPTAPEKFKKYSNEWRDEEIAAMMAIIEQMERRNELLEQQNETLEEIRVAVQPR